MIEEDVVANMATKDDLHEVRDRLDVIERRLDQIDRRLDHIEQSILADYLDRLQAVERAIGLRKVA